MNVIRLPFRWERIQNDVFSPLNEAELAELQKVTHWGRELDLCILLDIHNFGTYYGKSIGSEEVPVEALIDVWQRLAIRLGDPDYVMLGLMNEPSAISVHEWPRIAQKVLLTLREKGIPHFILVSSPRWSGAHEWTRKFGDQSPAEVFASFTDPLGRYAIELHQYADSNYSGTSTQCIEKEKLRKIMATVNAAPRPFGVRFFLGEFGVAENQTCLDDLQVLIESTHDENIWMGWAYWAAGRQWGGYPFSIQPKEQPKQLSVISSNIRVEKYNATKK